MKKMIALLLGAACFGVFASDLDINGEFKKLDKNNWPVGWTQNKGGDWAKPFGEGKIIKLTEKDGDVENAFQVVATEKTTPFYTAKTFAAKAGDTFEIEIEAKGKGNITAGIYIYSNEKGGWITATAKKFAVTEDFAEYKAVVTVVDGKPDKDGNVKIAGNVRFYFSAEPNSDVTFKKIEAELKK